MSTRIPLSKIMFQFFGSSLIIAGLYFLIVFISSIFGFNFSHEKRIEARKYVATEQSLSSDMQMKIMERKKRTDEKSKKFLFAGLALAAFGIGVSFIKKSHSIQK